MSDSKIQKEGRFMTLRDSAGNLITRVVDKGDERENWRNIMRRLTNNGQNQMEKLADISMGHAFTATMPDGRESEPMIPTLQLQAVTSQVILEMLHGKAVAQTEMRKAEEETKLVEQYRSLSDNELRAKVIDALAQRKVDVLPEPAPADNGNDARTNNSPGPGDERLE
jgi:hypothetical protein